MSYLLTLIPAPYRIAALTAFALALVAFGYVKGLQHGAEKAAVLAADQVAASQAALLARVASNATLAAKQRAANLKISKAHYEELAVVRSDLFFARRMRVPAFCPGVAGPAEAPGAAGSNAKDSGAGLLPRSVEADIQRLILETEETAATGRACQAFLRANELSP